MFIHFKGPTRSHLRENEYKISKIDIPQNDNMLTACEKKQRRNKTRAERKQNQFVPNVVIFDVK